MLGNVVAVFQKHLEVEHRGVSDISKVRVVFHFLREDVARISDSRDVIDTYIFRLMTFAKPYFF